MSQLNREHQKDKKSLANFERLIRFERELDFYLCQEVYDPTKFSLSDGDNAIVDDIFSYQQHNRLKNHFSSATLPTGRTGGMVNHDSDDNFLWLRNYNEDDDYLIFSEKTGVHYENLLTNSGIGVWSQSDTNEGIGAMDYDDGSVAPVVGELLTDDVSNAVGKVISYTLDSGTWGGGNAAGTIQLGACNGRFGDNNTVSGSSGGANILTVNMPNNAEGVDYIRNGELSSWNGAANPNNFPDEWSISTNDANNYINDNGDGTGQMVSDNTIPFHFAHTTDSDLKEGHLYTFSITITNWVSGDVRLNLLGAYVQAATQMGWGANGTYEFTFEAIATAPLEIRVYREGFGPGNYDFSKITLYEITPGCTGADTKAFDEWFKQSTLDIYRQHNDGGTLTKDGSFYSLKLTPAAADNYVFWLDDTKQTLAEYYQKYAGRTVTVGAWVKTSTASHFFLQIRDSDTSYGTYGSDSSVYHTGSGNWEWLEVTSEISAATSIFNIIMWCKAAPAVNGDTIVYVSQPMLVFGSSIGEGNYSQPPGEIVWLEKFITSNALNSLLSQSDHAGYATINIEADTDGKLPKGCKLVKLRIWGNDAGSAATYAALSLRGDVTIGEGMTLNVDGLTNDGIGTIIGEQACNSSGDIQYNLDASGANTFDIIGFRYLGVQVS